jgi:hypothetical protein
MASNLFDSFSKYLEKVQSKIREQQRSIKQLRVVFDRSVFERLETGVEFRRLIEETRKSDFPYLPDKAFYSLSLWEHAIKNFFCRSGLYLDIFENNALNIDLLFQMYLREFKK